MELSNTYLKKILFFMAPVSFLLLASCGSYEYSGYESDGIYGETNRVSQEQEQYATQDSNSSYYKNLFSEEAALYGEVLAEGAIFTDVEGYTSTGDYDPSNADQSNYQGGNAPWGEDPDRYTINIYNTGFYGGFYNPYWGGGIYAFDPYWGPAYYGPGFYGPGYWGPWGIGSRGYFPHRYGYGFGFGFAVHPFIYGGYGYYNPYNFHGYRYPHYRNNIAYNTGRRNSVSNFRDTRLNNLRNATSLGDRGRSSSYSRSIRNLRNSNDDYGISRRTYSREYQTRSNTNSRYSTNRSVNRSSQNRSSGTYSRSSNTNRSSGTVRSSAPTRSSGTTTRSSGSTSRSSGTTRSSSGGSSSRGRGN